MGVVKKLVRVSVVCLVTYLALMVSLCFPTPQKLMIYLHWLRLPYPANFATPEYYGFAHNAVRNVALLTADNVTLGAWHFLPTDYHAQQGLRDMDEPAVETFDQAIHDYDTFIYFHGNALHRAAPWRIDLYKMLRLQFPRSNLLAIDYRGFGDSSGTPSEDGLALDARAAFSWLLDRGVSPDKIALIGHSLGTGVATRLAQELSNEGLSPKALILQAPYSSITNLVFEYNLLEIFPLFGPLRGIGGLQDWMLSRLLHRFDSLSRISDVDCPILISHGAKDKEIPIQHAYDLFQIVSQGKSTAQPPSISVTNEAYVWAAQSRFHQPVMLAQLTLANHNNRRSKKSGEKK
ncbi:alpha/beta-hydrolase [Hesseltinella vesiculosa]|uniref:Alpha/beta-hydrolase n=1 Tax=Hesseltinella vesiculosa TaxID=101127 RepID=A0A1X2GP92_9FUNG|nr:alpha/beta-hydrolase [Hesseltinella vesiculosa]